MLHTVTDVRTRRGVPVWRGRFEAHAILRQLEAFVLLRDDAVTCIVPVMAVACLYRRPPPARTNDNHPRMGAPLGRP